MTQHTPVVYVTADPGAGSTTTTLTYTKRAAGAAVEPDASVDLLGQAIGP
jgi:hypothetical protein